MGNAMHFLRVLLLTTTLALTGVSAAPAQAPPPVQPSPEALQAAKDLVALVQPTIAEMIPRVTAAVWPQLEAAMRAQHPNIDAAAFADLRAAFDRVMKDIMADTLSNAPAVYAQFFTAAEMNEIAAFYRTPTGAKALTVMPQAASALMSVMLARIQSTQDKLNGEFASVLKKHGYAAQ
jgi:hypothetical protein